MLHCRIQLVVGPWRCHRGSAVAIGLEEAYGWFVWCMEGVVLETLEDGIGCCWLRAR